MKKTLNYIIPLAISIAFAFVACDDVADVIDDVDDGVETALLVSTIANYSNIVSQNYTDAYDDAQALQTAIDVFVADPSETTLEAAKEAWLESRETYGQTEAFRFYGGPIDDEDGPEGQLNAWPLDESHIDYVDGDFNANGEDDASGTNIINNLDDFPTITKEVISEQNENGGESNVSSGYHAIEFLLWGQDLSTDGGGGERAFTDYTTADNADRRGTYLSEAAQLLNDDLADLVSEWAIGGAYRTTFNTEENLTTSLESIVSALGKLSKGELAGERIFVAYDTRGKENEHSCFSDNTHRDIVTNALGIQNVYEGTYTSTDGTVISGTSIADYLEATDSDLAEEISTAMTESLEACEAIQAPFDQEFLDEDGRVRILAAITLLRDQGDKLSDAATALGFSFDPEDI